MTEISMPPNPSLWRRATAAYAKLLEILLAACVGILVIPVTLQIISRYTPFIPSYIWTEEMARFLFIWTIMIGAMVGIRESQHFEVDVWPDLSRRSEAAVRILARLGILAMAVVFVWAGPRQLRSFGILKAHPWRYRLTVRTEPSQGLNTGSIPVSATILSIVYKHIRLDSR